MARKGGLGPQGHAALQRAVATQAEITSHRAPRIAERAPSHLTNPSATSTDDPSEAANVPTTWHTFDSSRVQEAAYDPNHERLYVRFVKPAPGGTPWTYEGVPRNVWNNMRRTASAGKFVNRVLNQYNYHAGRWE